MGTPEEKISNYRSLLVKTCSENSDKSSSRRQKQPSRQSYLSKVRRPGYLLGEPMEVSDEESTPRSRSIAKEPYRILNAPKLKDDFYTNLIDWSPQDVVSVVLDNAVYVWTSKESETEKIVEGFVSSVKWGKGLVIGEETGKLRFIDVENKKETAKIRPH